VNETASRPWKKIVVLALLVGAVVVAYARFGDSLTLERLAEKEGELREYQGSHPVLVYGAAFILYVTVTGLSLPGAAPLTLVYGWYFGLLQGVILISFASTIGATLAFLLSRYFLRDAIQRRFGARLSSVHRALEKDGAFYLFTLRLIPVVPFWVINLVMGLTPIRVFTYWWVSQVGMLPGTVVYVYAGSSVPDLRTLSEEGVSGLVTPRLIAAFVVLGLFPFVVRFIMRKLRPDLDRGRREPDDPVEITK
jgi:uncharacterized membrane protein YdjX (TVP38/TMEM64 family)